MVSELSSAGQNEDLPDRTGFGSIGFAAAGFAVAGRTSTAGLMVSHAGR
jgi:hypothetical protein